MIGGLTKGDKAAEAGKTSNQPREVLVAEHVVNAINDLQKLHDRLCSPQGNDCVNDIQKFAQDGGGLCEFRLLQSYINYVEEDEPSIEKLTIMKFLRSIIEDEELYVKLHNFNFDYLHPDFDGIPGSIDYEEIRSQLSRIVTDCKLENLEDKIRLLVLLREKMNFADIQKAYDNWRFSDLVGDNDFKRMYVDQAVKEREKPVSEYFEENIGKYIKLVEEGKEITSRYFGKWKVNFQAYCEEINNNRVLNVNLIHYDKSEPTRISDILQQEKDIKELNIYCNKKHEIYAHQEDKKRYYEFKEGAYYEMKSTWPVKDGSEMCTMIMNVSSDGITEVLKFNGKDFVPSKEILELIKQNDELYIQGFSLYDAVMKSLEKGKAADVVPTANNNFQNESIAAYREEPEGELDPKVDADNSLPPSINSNVSTQTEVASQQIETQTEVNLQHTETQTEVASQQIETQTEVNLQHTETQTEVASQQIETQTEVNLQHTGTQTEVASQQMDELILNNRMLSKENVELKQEMSNLKKEAVELKQEIEAGLQVINKKHHELIQENQRLQEKLETTQAEANQTIVKLEKQNSDLQDKLGEERPKLDIEKPENEYEKSPEDIMPTLELTEDNVDELEENFGALSNIIADKIQTIEEMKEEIENLNNQVKYLEDQQDQVTDEQRMNKISSGYAKKYYTLINEHYVPKEKSDQRPVEIEQKIKESDRQDSDLQDRFEKKEQKNTELQTELARKDEELAELQGKAQELKSVCEEKEKLRQELEVVNAGKEELKSELKKLKKELYQVQEGKSDLENKFDQLERSNKEMNGNQEQLSEQVLDLQKELSCSKEAIQELINKLKNAEAEKKEVNQKLAEAGQRIETLKKQTSDLQDKLEKKERGFKAERDAMCKELTQLKENLEEKAQKLKSVYEEKGKLEDKLKGVNTEKKKLEDKLKEFEKEIDQAAHIMKEKEQSISNLKYQMLGLENEYKAQLESHEQEIDKLKWEIEERENKFKEYASILESMDREHEDEIKELEEKHDALIDIIADKVLDIEGLTKELQDSKKEIEDLRNQVEMLSAETFADKQKGLNDQFYTLTGDISSEPDNAPQPQSNLSRSSSVDKEFHAPQPKRNLSRSLSIDGGYGSDEENCDNKLPSSTGSDISIEKMAESRNVG